MTYQSEISRANPGCFLFLVDQSGSMLDGLAGSPRTKCDAVATAINRALNELIHNCVRDDVEPRHYFDVGVIGYTTDENNNPCIGSLLQHGSLSGRDLVSVVDLAANPLDTEVRQRDDGLGGLITVKFDIWYRNPPGALMQGTPMCAALNHCYKVLDDWCSARSNSFPPIVIHLTDGESGDGDPEDAANGLRSLFTNDGNLLLFNCHLSESKAEPVSFPVQEGQLPDEYSRLLFRMSSLLPEKMLALASERNLPATAGSRGMVFNADGVALLQLINVGTILSSPKALR